MSIVFPDGVAEHLSEEERREKVIDSVRALDDYGFERFMALLDKGTRMDLFSAVPEFQWRFLEILLKKTRELPR